MITQLQQLPKKALVIFIFLTPVLLNLFPNLYAFFKTPSGYSFTGNNSWFDPWDVNVYVSAIKFGQAGNILLSNYYSTVNHEPIIFYPLYTTIGFLMRFVNPYILFHAFSFITGTVLVFVLGLLTKIFLGRKYLKTGILLIAIGGGLGWLVPNALDTNMTGFTFHSAFQRPHESLGLICYISSLIFYYRSTRRKLSYNKMICIFLLLQVFIYPYLILSYFTIAFCDSVYLAIKLKSNHLKNILVQGLLVMPFLGFYLWQLYQNTAFNLVYNVKLPTPNATQLLVGYGIFSPILILQVLGGKRDPKRVFLNIWFFLSVGLSFLPFGFARFFLKSLFAPAVLLTLLFLPRLNKNMRITENIAVCLLLFFVLPTSIYMNYGRFVQTKNLSEWVYITNEQRASLSFLDKDDFRNKGLLSLYKMGNLIPANTNMKVYFGHFLQTPMASDKLRKAVAFYTKALNDKDAKTFLENEKIQFVYFGVEEQKLSKQFIKSDDLDYNFLERIYQSQNIVIYQMKK